LICFRLTAGKGSYSFNQSRPNVKAVLTTEYSNYDIDTMDLTDSARGAVEKKRKGPVLFSPESLMFERNKERHQFLRRLVGLALTPSAVAKGMPNIIASANDQLDHIPLTSKNNDVETDHPPMLVFGMCVFQNGYYSRALSLYMELY